MFVIPSLCLVFAVYAVYVDSFPQNDLGFPDGLGGPDEMIANRQGFRRPRQGFRPRPPGDNFGSPGFPGNNFNSGRPNFGQPNNGFRPQSSQAGNNFGSSGLSPGNSFNSRPGSNVRPTNTGSANNQRPNVNTQNVNGFGPSGSQGGNSQPTTSTTATSPGETTTRIPPRDPGNRIVYTVSCPCQYTRQYNPVCGTDGQTYGNLGVLECAQQCGAGVQIFLMGACGRNNG